MNTITNDELDPRTGRPLGDHGTANDAIDFILEYGCEADPFLRAWQQGDLDEWPEFYEWLASRESATLSTPSPQGVERRAREAAEAWRVPCSTDPNDTELCRPKDDCVWGFEQGYIAALSSHPLPGDDWRCVSCKRVVHSVAEPERCEACLGRTFAKMDRAPLLSEGVGG